MAEVLEFFKIDQIRVIKLETVRRNSVTLLSEAEGILNFSIKTRPKSVFERDYSLHIQRTDFF